MIGEEVRRRREELGLTGAQLAAKSGMAPSAVSQIETGKRNPSSTSVIKLAQALGIDAGALFPKEPQPSLYESEMEATLRAARENMTLLRAYFDDPPDEETADEAIEDFVELTPRVMEILAGMNRTEIGKYAGSVAKLLRENAEITKRLSAWNEAEYGHLHRDAG
jgi:transcriptional regulator with XRE-family HTH domain